MAQISVLTSIRAEPESPICAGRQHRFRTVRVPVEIEHPPPPGPLTWTIDGDERPELEDRNEVRITFSGGVHSVVARDETGEGSLHVTVIDDDTGRIKIETDPPMAQGQTRLAITAEPKMPEIRASAVVLNGERTSELEWTGFIDFSGQNCPPSQLGFRRFELPRLTGEEVILDFGGKIRGGFLTFVAGATFNSICSPPEVQAGFEGPFIDGTNPPRSAIQAALPHNTLKRIACKESGQRQFDAPPDGGVGPCPLFGVDGVRVGVMQIPDPTDDEIWNWRENVKRGIEIFNNIFNEGMHPERNYPNRVRKSAGFQLLVERFNQKREQEGLAAIAVVLPPFEIGDFDNNLRQLEEDTIRGYNGWHGPDRFGFELHEFRVAVDVVGGADVLRVTNINEGRGEAVWERVPVEERPQNIGDPDYVNNVLAFLEDCSPSAPPCNLTGISPTTETLFIGEPREFTAEGTGLADVDWSAPGGTPPTGTGPTFTTKWRTTGRKTLTATCGGTTKTARVRVLRVSIEINNTPSAKDNIVQVKCDHPARRFRVPCSISLVGPASGPLTIVLTNPDGRLRFPDPDDTTKTLELPANGAFTVFDITGETASAAKGDAKIQARLNTATGRVVTVKNVTVFTFDTAQILLTQGGNYTLVGNLYTVAGGNAVSFSSSARLRPAGLDCTAPQIANLRVAIMQEVSAVRFEVTWDSPTIVWLPSAPSGTTITAANTMRRSVVFLPTVAQPVNDSDRANAPLYSRNAAALKPPTGCAGAGAATNSDTPTNFRAHAAFFEDRFSSDGTRVARVIWTHRVNTTIAADFRTFCVVFNTATDEFCALRQAIWTLAVDSNGLPEDQHAIVQPDAAAAANPAVPPPISIDAVFPTISAVGADTTTFTR